MFATITYGIIYNSILPHGKLHNQQLLRTASQDFFPQRSDKETTFMVHSLLYSETNFKIFHTKVNLKNVRFFQKIYFYLF